MVYTMVPIPLSATPLSKNGIGKLSPPHHVNRILHHKLLHEISRCLKNVTKFYIFLIWNDVVSKYSTSLFFFFGRLSATLTCFAYYFVPNFNQWFSTTKFKFFWMLKSPLTYGIHRCFPTLYNSIRELLFDYLIIAIVPSILIASRHNKSTGL